MFDSRRQVEQAMLVEAKTFGLSEQVWRSYQRYVESYRPEDVEDYAECALRALDEWSVGG